MRNQHSPSSSPDPTAKPAHRLIASAVVLVCSLASQGALGQSAPEPAGSATAAAPAPFASAVSRPALHVESPSPVAVQRRTGEEAPWTPFCTSPCDEAFDGATQYRISGEGIRPSAPFYVVPGADGGAVVRVKPATLTSYRTGIGLLAGGGALIVAGAIVALAGSSADARAAQTNPTNGETSNSHTGVMFVASALIVSGVAVGIAGGATTLDNGRSSVSGSVRLVEERAPAQGARPPVRLEARRNEPPSAPPVAAVPFIAIPLLQGTFLEQQTTRFEPGEAHPIAHRSVVQEIP